MHSHRGSVRARGAGLIRSAVSEASAVPDRGSRQRLREKHIKISKLMSFGVRRPRYDYVNPVSAVAHTQSTGFVQRSDFQQFHSCRRRQTATNRFDAETQQSGENQRSVKVRLLRLNDEITPGQARQTSMSSGKSTGCRIASKPMCRYTENPLGNRRLTMRTVAHFPHYIGPRRSLYCARFRSCTALSRVIECRRPLATERRGQ